jgi:SOS-response transcriptional repressor LexA
MSTVMILAEVMRRCPAGVALRVVGRSMEPTLLDGDGILVDTSETDPMPGDIIAVNVTGAGPVRGRIVGRFQRDKAGFWLAKDNRDDPSWPRVFIGTSWSDFTIIGTLESIIERISRNRYDPERIRIRAKAAQTAATLVTPSPSNGPVTPRGRE